MKNLLETILAAVVLFIMALAASYVEVEEAPAAALVDWQETENDDQYYNQCPYGDAVLVNRDDQSKRITTECITLDKTRNVFKSYQYNFRTHKRGKVFREYPLTEWQAFTMDGEIMSNGDVIDNEESKNLPEISKSSLEETKDVPMEDFLIVQNNFQQKEEASGCSAGACSLVKKRR